MWKIVFFLRKHIFLLFRHCVNDSILDRATENLIFKNLESYFHNSFSPFETCKKRRNNQPTKSKKKNIRVIFRIQYYMSSYVCPVLENTSKNKRKLALLNRTELYVRGGATNDKRRKKNRWKIPPQVVVSVFFFSKTFEK